MPHPEHLEILNQGVTAWNAWREEHPDERPELSEARLWDRDLTEVNFRGAMLYKTNLSRAKLNRADLFEADLEGANLHGTNLTEANLTGALLDGARLRWAVLTHADLSRANLKQTRLIETVFGDTNLNGTIHLDKCVHNGPSILDNRTLARNPDLPIRFLRGCGLSDLEIEFAKLYRADLSADQITDIAYRITELRSDPVIQFHSCFISYASQNEPFARRLHDDLQDHGVRCWFAPEDLKIGEKIRRVIDEAIHLHDKLLLILSEDAIESGWVEYETDRAHALEIKQKRTVLFPIRIDEAVLNVEATWADFIREDRHIGDFSRWRDEAAYAEAFARLLRDLKAGDERVKD